MDEQNRNLILATALSFLVILVWFLLFPPEEPQPTDNLTEATGQELGSETSVPSVPQADLGDATAPTAIPGADTGETREAAAAATVRVPIETDRIEGSISLANESPAARPTAVSVPTVPSFELACIEMPLESVRTKVVTGPIAGNTSAA